MAITQINAIQQNVQTTVNMLVVMQGLQKMETEMKGVRGKVAAFKKSLESTGIKPFDLSGFISGGGLLKPFQEGLKKAIKAEDELASKSKNLKTPTLGKDALIPAPLGAPGTAQVPAVVKGETSTNLAKFNVSLDDISLKIGQALLPAVNGLVTALVPVMTSVGEFVADQSATGRRADGSSGSVHRRDDGGCGFQCCAHAARFADRPFCRRGCIGGRFDRRQLEADLSVFCPAVATDCSGGDPDGWLFPDAVRLHSDGDADQQLGAGQWLLRGAVGRTQSAGGTSHRLLCDVVCAIHRRR